MRLVGWRLPGNRLLFVAPLLALLLGGGLFAWRAAPSANDLLAPGSAPIVVSVLRPSDRSTYPANDYVPIEARAVGARPLAALELWVDGALLQREEAPANKNSQLLSARWTWQPGAEGEHTLLVRAVDAAGAASHSAALRLTATRPASPRLLLRAQGGETLAAVAQRLGLPTENVTAADAGLAPEEPLAAGQPLFVSPRIEAGATAPGGAATATPAAAPPGQAPPAAEVEGGDAGLWLKKRLAPPTLRPAAPSLVAVADGCSVRMTLQDKSADEDGFFVYRLGAGQTGFQRVATLGAGGGGALQWLDQGQSGQVQYYVAAFNGAGESASNVVGLNLAASCLAGQGGSAQVGGDLDLIDGKLIVERPCASAYYYTAVDGGPWRRVPADAKTFIPPLTGPQLQAWVAQAAGTVYAGLVDEATGPKRAFDLAAAAGDLALPAGSHSVAVEAWAWCNDGLQRLGDYSRAVTLPAGALQTELPQTLFSGSTDLIICGRQGTCTEGIGWTNSVLVPIDAPVQQRQIRWSTDSPLANGAVLQISTVPFGDQFDVAPPGLVATRSLAGQGGDVVVDFYPWGGVAAKSATPTAAPSKGPVSAQLPGAATLPAWLQSPSDEGSPLASVFGDQLQSAIGPGDLAKQLFTFDLYVRVTPMVGNLPAGSPSPTMIVSRGYTPEYKSPLAEVPPPPPGIHEVSIESFKPIVFPRGELWGCVTITRNDLYKGGSLGESIKALMGMEAIWSQVPVGTTVCPPVDKGAVQESWYESFFDFVAGAVEWAGKIYDGLKQGLINAVAMTIPFCGESCKMVLEVGLNAGMAALGLPPSLPSFDQLTDLAQGELVTLLAEQAGVDCGAGSACRLAIEAGIDALKKEAGAGGNNTACGTGATSMCLPAGVVGRPLEGSEYNPALLMVRVTRRADSAQVSEQDLANYQLSISPTITNPIFAGKTVSVATNTYITEGQYNHAKTYQEPLYVPDPLVAAGFAGVPPGGVMPRLKPGQSIVLPVYFDKAEYWIPGHKEMIAKEGGYVKYDDWFMLYMGGMARFHVEVSCVVPEPVSMMPKTVYCGYGETGKAAAEFQLPSDYSLPQTSAAGASVDAAAKN
ncbi:MAG: hypothetical protein ACYC4L_07405 [Chloroflexota bacterium]